MNKNKIKITEKELKQIVAESVKKVLSESRKPSDRTVGKHTLKGLRYDKNGNPLYTSDTMSDDEKKNQGWRFSKKHGLYGQLSDPTKLSENSTNINEIISADYSDALKQLLTKSFSNLNDNEKAFLSDLLNNEPWETIYTALNILGQNRVNEENIHTFYPNAASKEKGMIDNLNKKVDEIIKKQYPNANFYYEDDEAYDAYAEALLNLGFKKDGRDRNDSEVFSNGSLRVVIGLDSIGQSLIIHKANGYASTLGVH